MINLLKGDCLEILDDLEENSIDLVICDLPYGITKAEHDVKIPLNRYMVIKENRRGIEKKKGSL